MKRVLVSGVSGIVGYGILRSLRKASQDYLLIGTAIYDDSIAPAFCDVFERAPTTNSPEYLDWLIYVVRKHHIDLLIPGIEIDMHYWAEHGAKIRATGAILMLNTASLIALCRDKWAFYQRLIREKVPCIIESSIDSDYSRLVQRFGLPFLLKPRQGYGSKGIVLIRSEADFLNYRENIGSILMAQPIVGDDENEFTISAFCDGNGGYFAKMALRRKLSREGFTDRAEVADSSNFTSAMDELCQFLRPLGPTNFQFRLSSVGPKLLEINPRISSSTSIRTAFGYNESAMAVDYFLNQQFPTQPTIQRGRATRYIDEHIIYEDGVCF